ncbi:GNAT family N-acetyltransferase [Heyndrickxia sp. NPDC080065]|uniref:GNAT family N-acetyltransferase n=1 Tax=Heyndrickxia sp. NPDC080065 TaxID=3390568 RepID=UPI003D06C29B
MNVKILRSKKQDADELFAIQKEAFKSDFEKYHDYQTSPYTESYEEFMWRLRHSFHFTIYEGDKIVGGMNIMKISNTHYRIHQVFLKPSCQNKGFGSEIMKQVEDSFKAAKKWSLNTPKDNARNRHFYEKLGYKKIDEHKINDKLTLIEYVKTV